MPNLPANSRPLYRILTEKSRPGFGKFKDFTVGDILKVQPEYAVYLYYNHPQISFHESVLEKLGITERIGKPGTDVEAFYRWKTKQREGMTEEQILHGKFKRALLKKKHAIGRELRAAKFEMHSKQRLQAINHGHIKPRG